jgi:hypothetical protein
MRLNHNLFLRNYFAYRRLRLRWQQHRGERLAAQMGGLATCLVHLAVDNLKHNEAVKGT